MVSDPDTLVAGHLSAVSSFSFTALPRDWMHDVTVGMLRQGAREPTSGSALLQPGSLELVILSF